MFENVRSPDPSIESGAVPAAAAVFAALARYGLAAAVALAWLAFWAVTAWYQFGAGDAVGTAAVVLFAAFPLVAGPVLLRA